MAATPSAALRRRLGALVQEVLDARAGLDHVEALLNVIAQEHRRLASDAETRVALMAFADELMREHVIPDKLPLRKEAFARIAWRTALWADNRLSNRIGLFSAFLLQAQDAPREALALLELVEPNTRECNDPLLRAVLTMRARCLFELQRFDELHRLAHEYDKSAPHADDVLELEILSRAATAAAWARQLDSALDRSSRAVELFERGVTPFSETGTYVDLMFPTFNGTRVYLARGDVLRRAHDHLGAIAAYQAGREHALEKYDRVGAAWCLSEIAITWEHLSEFKRAAALLEQAAQEAEQAGDSRSAARWRKERVGGEDGVADMGGVNGLAAIAQAFHSPGADLAELAAQTKAIIKAERGTGTTIEPTARNMLAAIHLAAKQYPLALAAVGAAIAIADAQQELWLALSFRCNEALILFRMGLFDSANEVCDKIFEDARRFLDEANASEIRQAALSAVARAAEIALVTASDDKKHESGATVPRDPLRVLRVVDNARGRTFNRWIELTDWSRGTASPAVCEAVRSLVSAEMLVESAAQDARPMKPVLEERTRANERLALAAATSGLRVPAPSTQEPLSHLLAALGPHARIIDLCPVAPGVVLLDLEAGRAPRTEMLSWERKERVAWQARWKKAWRREASRFGPIGGVEAHDAEPVEHLYSELAARFVGPLAERLGTDVSRLIVALHAELAFVPLWTLARALPNVALSVVPTLRSIPMLAQRASAADGVYVSIGDASGTLPMADAECSLLAGFAPIEPTVAQLRDVAPRAARLHFAGHGEFDEASPYSSGVVLRGVSAPPHAVETPYAGCVRLTIPGITRELDLANCELAVLSTCSVGTPRSHAAGEFTSVPTAFLLAGAGAVVAAIWPVHDEATAVLMAHFYRSLESEGDTSRALAIARRKLRATTRQEACAILGRDVTIPGGNTPFESPIFTDAFAHYGVT